MKLTVNNLSFERNYEYLFEKINFELCAGELLQVIGANGCGKTTLLRMLAGLIYAEEGKICWNNISIFDALKDYQKHINYIGHQNGVKLYLNVEENIEWISSLIDEGNLDASLRWHDKLLFLNANIGNHTKKTLVSTGKSYLKTAMNLSAGQKRRLALIRLTLTPAKLWILDEPTTALDHEGQHQFFELLKNHLSQGGMAIITSHHDLPQNFHAKKLLLGEKHA